MATWLVPPPWSQAVRQRWVKGHMLAIAPGPWRLGRVVSSDQGGGSPLPAGGAVRRVGAENLGYGEQLIDLVGQALPDVVLTETSECPARTVRQQRAGSSRGSPGLASWC